jgi:hypothetical protein
LVGILTSYSTSRSLASRNADRIHPSHKMVTICLRPVRKYVPIIVIINFYLDFASSLKRLKSILWAAITDNDVETKIDK